jgi:hypothetical protein
VLTRCIPQSGPRPVKASGHYTTVKNVTLPERQGDAPVRVLLTRIRFGMANSSFGLSGIFRVGADP